MKEEVVPLKKFFANVVFILSSLLAGLVIVPWNNVEQWGLPLTQLTTYELYIKGGIGALVFIFSLIFLLVAIHDENNYGTVKASVLLAGFVPVLAVAIGYFGYAIAVMWYMVFRVEFTYLTAAIFYGLIFFLFNIIFLSHFMGKSYVHGKTFKRILLFLLSLEILGGSGFAAYFLKTNTETLYPGRYAGMYTYNYILIVAVALVFYLIHTVIISAKLKKVAVVGKDVETKVKELRSEEKPVKESKVSKSAKEEKVVKDTGNKTMIVSKEQTIISGEQNVDPTQVLYEDIVVDPEFNKTANADKQLSSIEYYIEKPKMFKPLDPAFDQLVAHVRELPNVVTKLADERITFYVDRKPFLVLMNFGNYYRMAFRSELEKGIRLIIKYPTISKNKSTKDNLWFKANNYGDLPKEVIFDIVKTAYDNVYA